MTKTLQPKPVAERDNDLKSTQHNTNYGVSPDIFEKVIEDIPAEQADILRWWYFHGKEEKLSFTKLAKRAGVNTSTLTRVFKGTYGAGIDSICATLRKAREGYAQAVDNPDFIMTSLARRMFAIFDETRALATVAILWGKMGTGKTTASENYKELNNHGRTIYYRCGSAVSFSVFLAELAAAMGILAKNRGHQEIRIKIKALMRAGQRLLIIDELHELFLTCRADVAIKICEFLREVHDVARCGLVLIGTPVLKKHLMEGVHAEPLKQLVNRSPDGPITLPGKHTKEDVIAIHSHYGLAEPGPGEPAAREILGNLVRTASLRKLALVIRAGARLAQIEQVKFTWDHVVAAHDRHVSLAKLTDEELKDAA